MDSKTRKINELRKEADNNYAEAKRYRLRLWAWKHAFALMLFVMFFVGGIALYWNTNVDEEGFCLEKIRAEFPEYNVQLYGGDGFHSDNTCTVHAVGSMEKRDGLLRLNNMDAVELRFSLTNSADQEYMAQDNVPTFWATLLSVFGVLGGFFTFVKWFDA